VFSYHSCRNRSCPKCHHHQTERGCNDNAAASCPAAISF
jgi:hypothetical protein